MQHALFYPPYVNNAQASKLVFFFNVTEAKPVGLLRFLSIPLNEITAPIMV